MKNEAFGQIVGQRCELIKTVLSVKEKEYARGDRLHNFKRSAAFMRVTPERACFSFSMKHFTSIADMIDDVDVDNPPSVAMINEKIGDAINYLILLEALLKERVNGVPV